MKTCHLFGLILCIMLLPALDGQERNPCWDTAKSQREMNECAGAELKAAEDALDRVYQRVRKQHADDKVFVGRLEAAQRAWAAFRDAELEAIFPKHGEPLEYGSVYPMCYAGWKTTLTTERTKQLRRWVDAVEEGNVCARSLLIRKESKK